VHFSEWKVLIKVFGGLFLYCRQTLAVAFIGMIGQSPGNNMVSIVNLPLSEMDYLTGLAYLNADAGMGIGSRIMGVIAQALWKDWLPEIILMFTVLIGRLVLVCFNHPGMLFLHL
jgi:hypothetical protein